MLDNAELEPFPQMPSNRIANGWFRLEKRPVTPVLALPYNLV